jgi:hypothetical protein
VVVRAYVLAKNTGDKKVRKVFRSVCFATVVLMLCGIYVLAVAKVTAG